MEKKIVCVISLAAVVAAVAISVRINRVNAGQHNGPVETYHMGEEVALEDNYMLEEYEIAEDYVVIVNNAEISTLENFLKKYGYAVEDIDTLFPDKDMTYPEMVYNVSITIRNVGTEEKEDAGMNVSAYDLMAVDYKLQINDILYATANPQMQDGTQVFRLRPQSEIELQLPFYFSVSKPYSYLTVDEVRNSDLYLVLSLYPTEKRILVRET